MLSDSSSPHKSPALSPRPKPTLQAIRLMLIKYIHAFVECLIYIVLKSTYATGKPDPD